MNERMNKQTNKRMKPQTNIVRNNCLASKHKGKLNYISKQTKDQTNKQTNKHITKHLLAKQKRVSE